MKRTEEYIVQTRFKRPNLSDWADLDTSWSQIISAAALADRRHRAEGTMEYRLIRRITTEEILDG